MPVGAVELYLSHKVSDIQLPLLAAGKIPLYSQSREETSAVRRELVAVVHKGAVHFIIVELA